MAKKYIDAELQIVRLEKNDIVCTSTLRFGDDATSIKGDAPDRFRDFEDYSY